jgi:hypothetical protein
MNATWCRPAWSMIACRYVLLLAALVFAQRTVNAAEGIVEGTSLPLAPGWTTCSLLASPHATQAAAADERHVYAVSSTTVAMYERDTGRLVVAATAPGTEHLNSGFLHEGRLYCAHSNYPRTPPESDIRVFDPATGRLELFHRFENPPGSLVWCVVRDGRWWCCFAHYGAENDRTVIVEYAPGSFTRELARYTFPRVVVADWDGMSGSGGIWDGDELLLSHHHFRVLYRLAVPLHGGVLEGGALEGGALELVAAHSCPFPGQGFARDPRSGGLVGIDRDHRRVVFAVPETAKNSSF